MVSKLSIHLVTWNGAKYIAPLFDSLKKQTHKDFEILVLDNNSQDNAAQKIKEQGIEVKLIQKEKNIGFTKAHNDLFRKSNCDYFLILNQDVYLEPDCLEKLVKFMDENGDASIASARLMSWEDGETVDSLGFKVFRNRRVVESYAHKNWEEIKEEITCHSEEPFAVAQDKLRGEGISSDNGIASPFGKLRARNDSIEVFGVSATVALCRRADMEKVAYENQELFDENYISYKEDVDLAYRMQSQGLKSYVLLDAAAYHDRSGLGAQELDDLSAALTKEKQPRLVKYHSYKNHLMTLYKNEYWQNFVLDFFPILWYEIKKFAYYLLVEPRILGGLRDIWKVRKDLKNKRQDTKNKRQKSWREIRRLQI